MHSCIPSHVVEVSYGHSCVSWRRILSGGAVIITVIHFIYSIVRFILFGVAINVIISDIKEGTSV